MPSNPITPYNLIDKKIECYLPFTLQTPLSVQCGDKEGTLLRYNSGDYVLPGSSIAGVLRAALQEAQGEDKAKLLFGDLNQGQSRLTVYDAPITEAHATTRDGVRLDIYKTAMDGAKYDFEALDAGCGVLHMTLDIREKDNETVLRGLLWELLGMLAAGDCAFGAKTHRGYGRLAFVDAQFTEGIYEYSFQNEAERKDWLFGRREGRNAKTPNPLQTSSLFHTLSLPLTLTGGLMIRRYGYRENEPDFVCLTNSKGQPVIPGTSWEGAIRSQLWKLLVYQYGWAEQDAAEQLSNYFGDLHDMKRGGSGEEVLRPSKVWISESVLTGSTPLLQTRNAIDRFTSGTVNSALYTSVPYYGGTTVLELRMKKKDYEDVILGLLLWACFDLSSGILAPGGETAVGRGVFAGEMDDLLWDGKPMEDALRTNAYKAAAAFAAQNIKKEASSNA